MSHALLYRQRLITIRVIIHSRTMRDHSNLNSVCNVSLRNWHSRWNLENTKLNYPSKFLKINKSECFFLWLKLNISKRKYIFPCLGVCLTYNLLLASGESGADTRHSLPQHSTYTSAKVKSPFLAYHKKHKP